MANKGAVYHITKLLRRAPWWMRDLAVTAGSSKLLWQRRRGVYRQKLDEYRRYHALSRTEMFAIQRQRLLALIDRAAVMSPYYREKYRGIDTDSAELSDLPVLEKEDLQLKIDSIVIGSKKGMSEMFTGGTTGRGIVVYNDISNMQERFALMDLFWARYGFTIGKQRIAWFSGRSLLEDGDLRRHRFWRTNWLYKVRYYSTFHLSQENLPYYVANLNRFKPQYFNGFPSAISEVARFVEMSGTPLTFTPKAIFVTSETLTAEQRSLFERVFRCPVADQYAASEGAPFIFQCPDGSLHIDVTTGVFEVIDDDGAPAVEGEMLVTGFITHETPIIRYRIGDRLRLAPADARCRCGWDTPLAEGILGRAADYIEVPGRGRIFNSQIGDCVKDVTTVVSFQVAVVGDRLEVDMLADRDAFEARDKATFLKKVRERVGDMPVDIRFVTSIPRAPSGKQSMVRRSS
jgi:phenylacetate-CoA ligase